MLLEKKVNFLENIYIGVLADSVYHYTKENVLHRIIEEKKTEQLKSGSQLVQFLGIKKAEDVFTVSEEVFNCAKWEIVKTESGFIAITKFCKLCSLCKKNGTDKPCDIYCLNPFEGMIKGINKAYGFDILKTLWDNTECKIQIKLI